MIPHTPNSGSAVKFIPSMLPPGVLTPPLQHQHMHPLAQQQLYHQQQAVMAHRLRRSSVSSGEDSEDSKECDVDSTSSPPVSNPLIIAPATSAAPTAMTSSANIHTMSRMDT